MLNNLILVILTLLLFSCQSLNNKKIDDNKENKLTDIKENTSQFQTVDSEDQANSLNAQTDKENQEIEVQDRIFFETNSSDLTDEAKKILDIQGEWLKSDLNITLTIEGHCDERGTREYNIALGEKRAFAVKKYLKNRGVDDKRLKIVSYGKERPAYIGNSDEIHSKNRRAVSVVN